MTDSNSDTDLQGHLNYLEDRFERLDKRVDELASEMGDVKWAIDDLQSRVDNADRRTDLDNRDDVGEVVTVVIDDYGQDGDPIGYVSGRVTVLHFSKSDVPSDNSVGTAVRARISDRGDGVYHAIPLEIIGDGE